MTLPGWRDWLFSAKAFLASMTALYIALAIDLPRPYWAMAAVYIVANPLAGATGSKALYRALGTVIGATASVLFLPIFVDAPILMSIVVAVWTGALLYVALIDRTPRSYVFMLAGYTLPLIALSEVGDPGAIFDTALARTEEILLGITCSAVIDAVVFPMSLRPSLAARIATWLDDAGEWAAEILRGEGAIPLAPIRRQKLATDISSLDLILSQLFYDAGTRDIQKHARALRGRLLLLLPLFSSLADRLHGLGAREAKLPAGLPPLLRMVADWIGQGAKGEPSTADALQAELSKLRPETEMVGWQEFIRSSALDRLAEIIDLWSDCLTLRAQIADGHGPWLPAFRNRRTVGRARHHDYGLMAFSAGSVVLCTIAASLVWIYTGWNEGAGFVTLAAVGCAFFASSDEPAPLLLSFTLWCGVSVFLAGVYLFGILPGLQGYPMLVLAFLPPFLLIGTLIPRPRTTMLGMLLVVNTASFVALSNRYSADFTAFTNGGIAGVAGGAFAYVWTLVTRPFGAEIAAKRLLLAGWRDLAETASGQRRDDHERLSGRMLDRLGQLVPRLSAMEDRDISKIDGFQEVRVGFNIVELQKQRRKLGPKAAGSVATLLGLITALYRNRAAEGRPVEPPETLRTAIDSALVAATMENAVQRRPTFDALVGLRRAFFPDSPPPLLADTTPPPEALGIAAE